jgi:hypothetical protein
LTLVGDPAQPATSAPPPIMPSNCRRWIDDAPPNLCAPTVFYLSQSVGEFTPE